MEEKSELGEKRKGEEGGTDSSVDLVVDLCGSDVVSNRESESGREDTSEVDGVLLEKSPVDPLQGEREKEPRSASSERRTRTVEGE